MIIHATTVAIATPFGPRAVALTGPSGVGKSDLALRLLEGPDVALISDDQTLVTREGEELILSAPSVLLGKIEARGFGVLTVPTAPPAPLALWAECVPPGTMLDRVPDMRKRTLLDLERPVIFLLPLEASAAAKLKRALASVVATQEGSGRSA
jgi:HPr kinase/phosphorylase